MAHRLGNPDAAERRLVRRDGEEVAHLLGVEFHETHASAAAAHGDGVGSGVVVFVVCRTLLGSGLVAGQLPGDFYLAATDRQSENLAFMLLREIAARAAESAADVEDGAAGWDCRALEEELD